jgi:hypothetical protein
MERFKSKKLLSAAGLLTLVGGAVAYIVLAAAVSCNTDGNCVGPTPQADLITLDDPAGGTGVIVDGLGGNDRIIPGTGGADANTLIGNTGNDLILGGASGDTINGNAGNDRLDGAGGNDTIGDNNGDNFCADTDEPGADRIVGGAGNEARICGGDGNDFIDAGDGADAVVFGNAGNDIMYGDTPGGTNPGNDTMDGGAGNDQLFGLDGDDSLTGGADGIGKPLRERSRGGFGFWGPLPRPLPDTERGGFPSPFRGGWGRGLESRKARNNLRKARKTALAVGSVIQGWCRDSRQSSMIVGSVKMRATSTTPPNKT